MIILMRFVNKLDLVGSNPSKMEVIAVTDNISRPQAGQKRTGSWPHHWQTGSRSIYPVDSAVKPFSSKSVKSSGQSTPKLVQKCGRRLYWDEWATDIADIAQTHITRITTIVQQYSQ